MIEWKSSAFSKSKRVQILLCIIILFYLLNGIYYLNSQSITSDEGSFMNYAIRLVKGKPERIHPMFDNSKMPVNVLNLAPRAMAQLLNPGLKKYDEGVSDIIAGRYVTLLISLFTILIAFKWSSENYMAAMPDFFLPFSSASVPILLQTPVWLQPTVILLCF